MAFLFAKSFPFCATESTAQTGEGTDYPFEMTLKDAMALYWKFLSLKITDNLVYSFTRDGGTPSNCVATHAFSDSFVTSSYWPSKMSEMICPPPPYFYGSLFANPIGVFTSSLGGTYSPDGFYSLSYGGNIITKKINGLYKFYPSFLLEISTNLEYDSRYSTRNNGGIASQIVTLKIDNTDYKTNLYVFSSDYGHSSASLSGSIVIEKASDRIAE
jgi:hypothetical protein